MNCDDPRSSIFSGQALQATALAPLLTNALIAQDRLDDAEPLALEQQQLCIEQFGPKHPHSIQAATLLFDLADKRGDIEQMEQIAAQLNGTQWEKPAQEMLDQAKQKQRLDNPKQ